MSLPVVLDTSRAVLFLGSGFSSGATAIYGRSPPIGDGLRDILASRLGVPAEQYTLQILANGFTRREDLDLFDLFRSMFTISSVNQDLKDIMSRRWLRIYTTNYDDAAEVAFSANQIRPQSYNYDDEKPRKTARNSVVHLHGMISKATEDNLLEQLVLSQKTYIRQRFETSSWYDEFRRDIIFCDAVFFIGYSLQDAHITALIPRSAEIPKKTFFITKGIPDQLFKEDLEEYGEIHPIEIAGFAATCKNFVQPPPLSDVSKLKSLKLVDIFKDHKSILPPTSNEVLDLIAFGIFSERRCLSNLPNADYIVPRTNLISRIVPLLEKNTTILLHSRLGNGKTTFMWSLAHHLTSKGYVCFRCISNSPDIESELAALQNQPKPVIFFDDYDTAIDCADRALDLVQQAKFVINVRSARQQVRIHEIRVKLPDPITRIDINSIDAEDRSDFISLLGNTGVMKDDLANRIRNASDIRDIVTVIYDNTYVRNRIDRAIAPMLNDKKALATVGISLIVAWIGQPADVSLFQELLEIDPFIVLEKYREEASDIFDLEAETLTAKSSVFAEYLLNHQFDVDDIITLVERILVVAVTKKIERRYRQILSSLMSFAQLTRLLKGFTGSREKIRALYDKLQRDIEIREEPLFWLQYAIATMDHGRADLAEGFMINAYEKAKTNPSFETYQLDTQALRLNLLLEQLESSGQKIVRLEKILKNSEDVRRMISDHSHREFAVKVLGCFRPFIESRNADLLDKDRVDLVETLRGLSEAIGALSPGARAETGADLMKADLDLCLGKLVAL